MFQYVNEVTKISGKLSIKIGEDFQNCEKPKWNNWKRKTFHYLGEHRMFKHLRKSCQIHFVTGLAPNENFVWAARDSIRNEVNLRNPILQSMLLLPTASYESQLDEIGNHSLPFCPRSQFDYMVGIPGLSHPDLG